MQDYSVLSPYLTGYNHLACIEYEKIKYIEISKKVRNLYYLHKKLGEYSLSMKQPLLFA